MYLLSPFSRVRVLPTLAFALLASASSWSCAESNSSTDEGSDIPIDSGGDSSWVVGGWIETTDAWFGVLSVVSDLSSDNQLELKDVTQFDGDFTYAAHKSAIYVGHEDNHIIDKWLVSDGALTKTDEVSFAAFGVTHTDGDSHNVIQIIDDETGWFFDHENTRVLIFNPSTMSTTGVSLDYSELFDGLDEKVDWADIGDVGRVGNYLAVPMFWYHWEEPKVEPIPLETRIALIDTTNNSVQITVDKRCAGSNVMANDDEGNLYFGPHSAAALHSAKGKAGDSVPCIIRILNGEADVDQDYLVDLNTSAKGIASGVYAGPGKHGYVLRYEGAEADLGQARFADKWRLYHFELGAAAPKFSLVDDFPIGTTGEINFNVQADGKKKYYITSNAAQGAQAAYYQILEDGSVEKGLGFPVYAGPAVNY